jgi:hypothetical protein
MIKKFNNINFAGGVCKIHDFVPVIMVALPIALSLYQWRCVFFE